MFAHTVPKDRHGIIYCLTQRDSGKQYVGQTVRSLRKRWRSHGEPCRKGCSAINSAIQKYGHNAFLVETLDWASSQEELDHKERFWIAFLNVVAPQGYNLRDGGNGGSKLHPDSVAKMAATKRGRPLPDGHPFKGKGPKPWVSHYVRSPEQLQRLSERMQRQFASGWKHPMQGRKHTEESRQLIRAKSHPTRLNCRRPIMCVETGQVFDGAITAAAWLVTLNESKIPTILSRLSQVLDHPNRVAYGYHWKRVSPQPSAPTSP